MKRLIWILAFLPSFLSAEVVNCGYVEINRLLVQGDREGEHGHENALIVEPWKNNQHYHCEQRPYVYMKLDNPAYQSVLSVLLAAQAQGKTAEIWINSSVVVGGNASQIAWVTIAQ